MMGTSSIMPATGRAFAAMRMTNCIFSITRPSIYSRRAGNRSRITGGATGGAWTNNYRSGVPRENRTLIASSTSSSVNRYTIGTIRTSVLEDQDLVPHHNGEREIGNCDRAMRDSLIYCLFCCDPCDEPPVSSRRQCHIPYIVSACQHDLKRSYMRRDHEPNFHAFRQCIYYFAI
jgi:hypothetical protein